MITKEQKLAWVAALLEGEGCFIAAPHTSTTGRYYYEYRIACNMCDGDVIARLNKWSKVGSHNGPYPSKKPNYSPQFRWSANRRDEVRKLLIQILPFMGKRRSKKIKGMLSLMHKYPGRSKWHHGSRQGYEKGCRCRRCRKAHALRFLLKRRKLGIGPRIARHGSRSMYVKGCRCGRCIKSNREYQTLGPLKNRNKIPAVPASCVIKSQALSSCD